MLGRGAVACHSFKSQTSHTGIIYGVPKLSFSRPHTNQHVCSKNLVCNSAPTTGPLTSSPKPTAGSEHHRLITSAVSDIQSLVQLGFKGKIGSDLQWRQVTVRPVEIKGNMQLQVSYFDQRQNITKNFPVSTFQEKLQELLGLPFSSITLKTVNEDVNIQLTRKGKAIIQRSGVEKPRLVRLEHDHSKDLPLPNKPDPFLIKIGIQTSEGRIKADMSDKYTQINEFLKLLKHTGLPELQQQHPTRFPPSPPTTLSSSSSPDTSSNSSTDSVMNSTQSSSSSSTPSSSNTKEAGSSSSQAGSSTDEAGSSSVEASSSTATAAESLHILDCGCGSAHLTLGTYHYLNNVLGVPATLEGVDVNARLMEKSNAICADLGINAKFHTSSIMKFTPSFIPDIVLALHACDTATDQALALGVKQGASIIMAVPCCHKDLQQQMSGKQAPLFDPMLRHGIIKQRFADMLTDSLRALLLRILGYKTDIVEFVSTEHTPRNLLIRAVRQVPSSDNGAAQLPPATQLKKMVSEYDALVKYWGVTPHLEVLLQQELALARAIIDV